jgi:NADH-quinone oxidoreductase subunit F
MFIGAIGCEPLQLARVLLANSHSLEVYRQHGGYESLRKVLTSMSPDDVINEVKKSALRGRGGAGFPTGMKWSFVPKDSPKPKYVVCNADESEPGTFKDRYLMERDPHLLIEGMLIAAYALGAKTNYIYTRGEYRYLIDIMDRALEEARGAGLLGERILGTEFARTSADEASLPCRLRSLRVSHRRQQRRDAYGRPRHYQNWRRGLSEVRDGKERRHEAVVRFRSR